MKKHLSILLIAAVLLTFLFSCNPIKYLHKGEKLYTGGEIKLKPPPKHAKPIRKKLQSLLRPIPNTSIFGIMPALFLYNISKKPTGKGLNYLFHEKWGQPPVLASSLNLGANRQILRNHLQHTGFLHANVAADSVSQNQKVKAVYIVNSGIRYTINKVIFPQDSRPVDLAINLSKKKTLLYPKAFYNLDAIKNERIRIADSLKNRGYFYFNANNLIMQVDSNLNGKVDIYIRIKPGTSSLALKPYIIRHVNIYADYSLNRDSVLQKDTGYEYHGMNIIDPEHLYHPSVFSRSVFLDSGNLYTVKDHNLTLQRLVNLGAFKFVNAEFERVRTKGDTGYLNTDIYLTPYKRRSVRFELNSNSRSNNYVGSALVVNWQDRNFFRGAERFQLQMSGGFETQVGGQQDASNIYSFSPGATLTMPRFVTPFNIINMARVAVPKTQFSVNYELLNREKYYTLNSFTLQAGYHWRESNKKTHTLNLIEINYVLPSHQTQSFKNILEQNPILAQSFRKQFILGSNYDFVYTDQLEKDKKSNFYFNGHLELSGNIAGLIAGKHDVDHPAKIYGVPFSQYVKVSSDLRNYLYLNEKGLTWANRLFTGWGYSYGNSYSIPYVKQFFIGGSNSLRGFREGTLGPGSYHTSQTNFQANEAGDIKLEANSELRMNLVSIIKGAVFVDAGNIWLLRADSSQPKAQFHLHSVLKQLAVDGGVGLRFDVSFFVLRFDLAFPLRKPWLPEGQRWVLNQIDFGSKQWRKENLILNIAIGYPF